METKDLLAGTTPRPWRHVSQFVTGRDGRRSEVAIVSQQSGRTVLSLGEAPGQSLADITLIAAAPTLAAENAALRAQVAELAGALDRIRGQALGAADIGEHEARERLAMIRHEARNAIGYAKVTA
jgi:hypothetical protein